MKKHSLKDPGSAITHFIGMILSIFASIPLLIQASQKSKSIYMIALTIFVISIILLYTASTTYHSFNISEKANRRLRKIDHIMISVLIAGTYTPICLIALNDITGIILLSLVWMFAVTAILLKLFWITCPKWVSSVLYIAMGWTCILAFPKIYHSLSFAAFLWLLVGGIIYTIGGVIYALKLSIFNMKHKHFGSHEIFHLFVMGGSFCHFVVMYLLLL